MGGWKPAKKDAQRITVFKATAQMRLVDISNRIHECYNKLADLNKRLIDEDIRPDIKRDIDARINYYTDELWIAIESKETLEREAEAFEVELLKTCRN